MNSAFQVLAGINTVVGESSRWSKRDQCLYWIDAQSPYLFCYSDIAKTAKAYKLPSTLACIDLDFDGSIIGIMSNALVKINIINQHVIINKINTNLLESDGTSFNDGLLDLQGNLWVGTTDKTYQNNIGKLYRISPFGEIVVMDEGFVVSNGLGWSPDKTKFYFTDSIKKIIYQYEFDSASCQIKNKKTLIQFTETQGFPDGLYIDQEGYIWVAGWGCYHLYQYSSQGNLIRKIQLPAKNLTSCCFGGSEFKTLFVTSANFDLVNMNDVGMNAGSLFISNPMTLDMNN